MNTPNQGDGELRLTLQADLMRPLLTPDLSAASRVPLFPHAQTMNTSLRGFAHLP